ncbi:hypothetical protein Clacol_004728 [Clathrus columnatus]|uniref:3-carboxymuconate cyclase n=1 Tax=Clathrus columnatus TaxID=1419009 RepID=A0AAV5A7A4_9AGAM|nr:hypothetical protein Clacol_004728 [Clathrus columnatus]
MTNEPSGNFIIGSEIGSDGTLSFGNAIWAGGQGSHGNSTGPDALFSQGSIKVSGQHLFALNAGSNTVTMFSITPSDPTRLKMIGQPTGTGGDFPMSLTVSGQTGQVCVLNGGTFNGVNCFKQDSKLGLVQMNNTQRSLSLDLTTPPSGPANSISHVLFSEDGSQLLASVKGTPTAPGFVASWDVDPQTGALSSDFIKSQPGTGGGLPFGMAVIPGKNAVLATDPASGFDVFDYNNLTSAGAPSIINAVAGQKAVCWAAFSNQTGNFYLTDIGTGMVTEVNVDNNLQSSIVKQYPQGNGSSTIDDEVATINGQDFLYVLAAGNKAVMVMSLKGPGDAVPLQQFNVANEVTNHGVTIDSDNMQGLAVFTGQ